MSNLYTQFSNYEEINSENRKHSASVDPIKWGENAERYETYRKEWNKAAEEDYLPSHPLHVDIELSDACNLRCKMCGHGLGTIKQSGTMGFETVQKILDESVEIGVCAVKFNWRGEPTLSPFLPDAVKYAKEKGILEVQINTNGNVPKKYADSLIKCAENGIDRIIFSVDGFSAETYEEVRVGGHYEDVKSNILSLLEWKKTNQATKPLVRIQMVRTVLNAHEVSDFIQFWQPKVDDVRISDVMDRGQGNSLSVGDQITVGRRRCPQPFLRLTIGRDGRVSPCCADWNQEVVVGDIFKESLMAIWNNKLMTAMREVQRRCHHDHIPICKNCYVKESFIWKKSK